MKKFRSHARGWLKRAVVLSSVALTVVELSAQGVSEYGGMTLPDLTPAIAHPRAAALTSPFKPLNLGNLATHDHLRTDPPNLAAPYAPRLVMPKMPYRSLTPLAPLSAPNELNARLPVYAGGDMSLFSRGGYALGLAGSHRSYPSLGFSNTFTVGQSMTVTDGITIHGGVYASDNLYRAGRFKDFGVSGSVRIEVTDGVTLMGYGNYSVYNSAGAGRAMPPMMYPGNSYGGALEVRVTDKFGLLGGVNREYNAFTRRWETTRYILPVFY